MHDPGRIFLFLLKTVNSAENILRKVFLLSPPWRTPFRSSLIVIAVASSMMLATVMLSLGEGVRTSTRDTIDRIGADVYVVPKDLNPLLVNLHRFDQGTEIINALERSPYPPTLTSPRLRDSLFIDPEGDGDIIEVSAFGIDPASEFGFGQFEHLEGETLEVSGDPLREEFILSGVVDPSLLTGMVMVSEELAGGRDIGLGDTIEVTTRITGGRALSCVVAGTFSNILAVRSEGLLMPLGELQYIKDLLGNDTMTEILLSFDDGENAASLIEWSRGGDFWGENAVDLLSREDILGELYRFTSIIGGFSALVITVSISVSLIFISVVLMTSTKESGEVISMLRAIGFSRLSIVRQVFLESMFVSAIGGVLGLLLGLAAVGYLGDHLGSFANGLPPGFELFVVDGSVLLLVLVLFIPIAMGSGMVPALITSRMRPVESLRGEMR